MDQFLSIEWGLGVGLWLYMAKQTKGYIHAKLLRHPAPGEGEGLGVVKVNLHLTPDQRHAHLVRDNKWYTQSYLCSKCDTPFKYNSMSHIYVIKRGNSVVNLRTPLLHFLDICNYCAPGTSYFQYLQPYGKDLDLGKSSRYFIQGSCPQRNATPQVRLHIEWSEHARRGLGQLLGWDGKLQGSAGNDIESKLSAISSFIITIWTMFFP